MQAKSAYANHLAVVLSRVHSALQRSGFEQLAVHSGMPRMAFQDDYAFPFKPNPNFLQFVPLAQHPHSWVVIRPGRKPRLIFLQPRDYWHVVPSDPQGEFTEHFEISIVREARDARPLIDFQPPTAFIGGDADAFANWGFAAMNPRPLLAQLHWQRAYKTAHEVECLRLANVRGARAHEAARTAFEAGASEYEIHLDYLRAAQHLDKELPYGNIIALNAHGAVLHYSDMERTAPAQRHSFLIDAGAQIHGYAADITRTHSAHKDEFAALIAAMDAMQLGLIADIKPGRSYLDVHLAAHRGVATILAQFGFVKLGVDEMLAADVTSTFFPHGIGHLLGLQVHDIGGHFANDAGELLPPPAAHRYLRLTRTIETDMVFTIEPGLYFIDMLLEELAQKPCASAVDWGKVEAFKRYGGIRVEDNVLVTAGGTRNLTREAFAH
jgi:Xaa-Pro dipeptidase